MDDNSTVCPKCGCPIKNVTVKEDVLNEGKGTEAESVISDYANNILSWSHIIAIIACVGQIIRVCVGAASLSNIEGGEDPVILMLILGLFQAFLYFLIIKFVAKLIWAGLMLFVNISTNLKRIEIQIEKYGTHKMS